MKCNCHNEIDLCVEIVPIFNSLSFDEKIELAKIAIHKKFKRGEYIYQAGDKQEYLFIVHRGKIKVTRYSEDERTNNKNSWWSEFIGELSLFANSNLTDYAVALEDTSICMLAGDVVRKYIEKEPNSRFEDNGWVE